MTKDYKETPKKSTSDNSGYGWMLSGIAIGLLVGLGMYYYSNHENAQLDATLPEETGDNLAVAEGAEPAGIENLDQNGAGLQEPDPISVVIESARQEQQDRKRATFSYYAVLPNLELDVNIKPSEADLPEKPKQGKEELSLPSGSYLLQIASFRSEAQAVSAQGKLKNQGLNTQIEAKTIKGKLWYRLFAGPTEQTAELTGWKTQVEKVGFEPLILKKKP